MRHITWEAAALVPALASSLADVISIIDQLVCECLGFPLCFDQIPFFFFYVGLKSLACVFRLALFSH